MSNITQGDITLERSNLLVNWTTLTTIETYCFCYNYYTVNGLKQAQNFTLPDNSYPCKDWGNQVFNQIVIEWGTIFVLPIVNFILVLIIRAYTSTERNKTKSDDQVSNLIKMTLIQIINTVNSYLYRF